MAMTSLFGLLAESQSLKGSVTPTGDLETKLIKDTKHEGEPENFMPFEYESPIASNQNHAVVVIGGGLAGLMAGWMLASQDYDVTVLEAQNRVGGRVDTRPTGSGLVEAGAELIGKIHSRWVKLAHHFNLGLSPISTEEMYAWQKLSLPTFVNGKRLDMKAKEVIGKQLEAALKDLNAAANQVNPYEPWTCPNASLWDSMSVSDWINTLKTKGTISSEAATMLEYDLGTNQALPVTDQSYLGLLAAIRGGSLAPLTGRVAPYWEDSETFRCSSGNQKLAEEMMEACKTDGGNVCLLESVKEVSWENNKWKIYTDQRYKDKPITADWVVLAIPPSVWGNIRFKPATLTQQVSQLQPFCVGPAVKYLAYVKERFWLSQGLAPAAEHTAFGLVWEGTDNQNLQKSSRKTLTVFAGGPLANSSKWGAHPHTYFQNWLESIYAGFKQNVDTQLSDIVEWPTFVWTKCGYSCPGVNQVTTISKHLAAPLGQLVFAGEHTSAAYFGFMEGALESGMRAAHHIFKGTGVTPLLNKQIENSK